MTFCLACKCPLPENSRFCNQCGTAVPHAVRSSAKPTGKQIRASKLIGGLLIGLSSLGLLLVLSSFKGNQSVPSSAASTITTSGTQDEANMLISKCGDPSSDSSSENEYPRPPIP